MWDRDYQDYKRDQPLKQQRIEPGKGWAGCEMNERNGWGNTLHHPKKKKRGMLASLLIYLFHPKKEDQR
jgi:hypothetical protein